MAAKDKPNIEVRFTPKQQALVVELLPSLAERFLADPKTKTARFSAEELESLAELAEAKVSPGMHGTVRNMLRTVAEKAGQAAERSRTIEAIPAHKRIYQFKIQLRYLEPAIWRRIQVRDCTLDRFHEHLQNAFGWHNAHLNQFMINGTNYGDPSLFSAGPFGMQCEDSFDVRISQIVPKNGNRFRFEYEYDFGDSWLHDIEFEECLEALPGQQFPICVDGGRACPPEDCGGPPGYEMLLDALEHPEMQESEELLEFYGDFDPNAFSPEATTQKMR